jgi:hypothetical protein
MKLAKLLVWGCGVLAVAVFGYVWHRYSGWYDWRSFPAGPLLRQVAVPATLAGAIFGLTVWIASKQR